MDLYNTCICFTFWSDWQEKPFHDILNFFKCTCKCSITLLIDFAWFQFTISLLNAQDLKISNLMLSPKGFPYLMKPRTKNILVFFMHYRFAYLEDWRSCETISIDELNPINFLYPTPWWCMFCSESTALQLPVTRELITWWNLLKCISDNLPCPMVLKSLSQPVRPVPRIKTVTACHWTYEMKLIINPSAARLKHPTSMKFHPIFRVSQV